MSRFFSAGALAVLLIVCATLSVGAGRAGAGSAEPAGGTSADAPAICTNYSTGADTHTACTPSASAPQGSAIACRNYSVGSDTHAECGPVPAARLSVPRQKNAAQVPPPASALRCYTYHIGSSSYTDCR